MTFNKFIKDEATRGFQRLANRISKLESDESFTLLKAYGVVSAPPTNAQIDGLLDTPSNIGTDCLALIIDTVNGRYYAAFGDKDTDDWYVTALTLTV